MKKNKPVQYFKTDYLEQMKDTTPTQIAEFLESYRRLQAATPLENSILISLRVPEELLKAFRFKAEQSGQKYQTLIKKLMMDYLKK